MVVVHIRIMCRDAQGRNQGGTGDNRSHWHAALEGQCSASVQNKVYTWWKNTTSQIPLTADSSSNRATAQQSTHILPGLGRAERPGSCLDQLNDTLHAVSIERGLQGAHNTPVPVKLSQPPDTSANPIQASSTSASGIVLCQASHMCWMPKACFQQLLQLSILSPCC
jgi:hypothetical protein